MLVLFLSISNSKVKADFSPSDAEGGILRHIKAASVGSHLSNVTGRLLCSSNPNACFSTSATSSRPHASAVSAFTTKSRLLLKSINYHYKICEHEE